MKKIKGVVTIILLFLPIIITGEKISILKATYWNQIIITESNMRIPNRIIYGPQETLVFIGEKIHRYKSSDYSKYEILQNTNNIIEPKTDYIDYRGSKVFQIDGQLFFADNKTGLNSEVISKRHTKFYEIDVDVRRQRAFIIGVPEGLLYGSLYVFNTNNPYMINHATIMMEEIKPLGENIRVLSIDQESGNIAIVEKMYNINGWRIKLLLANDFKLIMDKRDETDDHLYSKLKLTDTDYKNISLTYQSVFKITVDQLSNDLITICSQKSNNRTRSLIIENHELRREITNLRRTNAYTLKSKDLYLNSLMNTANVDQQKNEENLVINREFSTYIEKSGKDIISSLNENVMIWRDETECGIYLKKDNFSTTVYTPEQKIHKCGMMPRHASKEFVHWAVFILRSPTVHIPDYSYVCYGALIHPKVVIVNSRACAINMSNPDSHYITRSGKWDEKLFTTISPYNDRRVINVIEGGEHLQFLILDQEYSSYRVICLPEEANLFKQILRCFIIKKQYYKDGKYVLKTVYDSARSIKKCEDSEFLCRLMNKCEEKYEIMFCHKQRKGLKSVMLAAINMNNQDCKDILLDVYKVKDIINDVLSKPEYDLAPYHLPIEE